MVQNIVSYSIHVIAEYNLLGSKIICQQIYQKSTNSEPHPDTGSDEPDTLVCDNASKILNIHAE